MWLSSCPPKLHSHIHYIGYSILFKIALSTVQKFKLLLLVHMNLAILPFPALVEAGQYQVTAVPLGATWGSCINGGYDVRVHAVSVRVGMQAIRLPGTLAWTFLCIRRLYTSRPPWMVFWVELFKDIGRAGWHMNTLGVTNVDANCQCLGFMTVKS